MIWFFFSIVFYLVVSLKGNFVGNVLCAVSIVFEILHCGSRPGDKRESVLKNVAKIAKSSIICANAKSFVAQN